MAHPNSTTRPEQRELRVDGVYVRCPMKVFNTRQREEWGFVSMTAELLDAISFPEHPFGWTQSSPKARRSSSNVENSLTLSYTRRILVRYILLLFISRFIASSSSCWKYTLSKKVRSTTLTAVSFKAIRVAVHR